MKTTKLATVLAGALALSTALGVTSAKAEEFINVLTGGTSGVY